MTTIEAVQNLDNLISASRMTRQEHIGMSQSLDHLRIRASLLDAQEQKAKEEAEKKAKKKAKNDPINPVDSVDPVDTKEENN